MKKYLTTLSQKRVEDNENECKFTPRWWSLVGNTADFGTGGLGSVFFIDSQTFPPPPRVIPRSVFVTRKFETAQKRKVDGHELS